MSIRPEDVRIVHADGTATVVELAHARIDDEGYDIWTVITEVDFHAGDHVEIGVMPQMCGIEFPLKDWTEVTT